MTWSSPVQFRDAVNNGDAAHVVEMLAARDVDLDVDAVHLLIGIARLAHRRALSSWLQSHEHGYAPPPSTGPWARWINRRPGNAGRFRDGSDLPRVPLASIYFLCNEWWRRELGTAFWCDFRAAHLGDDYAGREKLEFINAAAAFFVLIAQAVDFNNYTAKRCSLIHDGNYRKLDRRIP